MIYPTLGTIVEMGYKLPLNSYPIFEEEYRQRLNTKIIDHYYFNEINGTPDRFSFYLRRKLNEVMPYFNQLYQSECIKFNPLYNSYVREVLTENGFITGYSSDKTGNVSRETMNEKEDSARHGKEDTSGQEESTGTETGNMQYTKYGDRDTTGNKTDKANLQAETVENEKTVDDRTVSKTENTNETTTATRTDDLEELRTPDLMERSDRADDNSRKRDYDMSVKTDRTAESTTNVKELDRQSDCPDSMLLDAALTQLYTTTAIDNDHETNVRESEEKTETTTGGYLDTENLSWHSNTQNTGTETTTNTGTQKNDSELNRQTDENETLKDTVVRDLTRDVTEERTGETDETGHEDFREAGEENRDSNTNNLTNRTGNLITDYRDFKNVINFKNFRTDSIAKTNHGENNTKNLIREVFGQNDSPSSLLMEFRETFLNIDLQVISSLATLFMGVYDYEYYC